MENAIHTAYISDKTGAKFLLTKSKISAESALNNLEKKLKDAAKKPSRNNYEMFSFDLNSMYCVVDGEVVSFSINSNGNTDLDNLSDDELLELLAA
jgi:hypothetical protein